MRSSIPAFVILWTALGAAAGAVSAEPASALSLEYLSEYLIPAGLRFEGTCVGGLSALEYDATGDRYYALSDSSRNARFYTLDIDLDTDPEGRPYVAAAAIRSVVRLRTREGEPYPDGRVDPEGFVLVTGREAFVSSEGIADQGVPPFVDRVNVATGGFLQAAAVPVAYRPERVGETQLRGTRQNLGFESLALSPDRRDLYAATESALAQDVGSEIPAGSTVFARLLHYRVEETPRLEAEVLYPLEQPEDDAPIHGLVELQALDSEGRLLAMERTFGREIGLAVKLFEVRWGEFLEDVDRSSLSPAARHLPVLAKRPVLDLGDLPILLDNFEGLTFGPPLPGGGESLLVLGDNDNTECRPALDPARLRPTKILLFRLKR